MEITNRHSGKIFIIGGTSPYNPVISRSVWKESIVIGVNNFPKIRKCHYWLTCDPHRIDTRMPGVLELVKGIETFMFRIGDPKHEPTHWFDRPATKLNHHLQPEAEYLIPTHWVGCLQHVWTSATAAANLAAIMGASKIILYKVDLIGKTRSGGGMIPWAEFAPDVSEFFKRLPVPVYKTNPNSPLDLPLWIN